MFQLTKKNGLILVLPGLMVAGLFWGLSFNKASAITGSDWNAGNIISDSQFFDPSSMSTSDIQSLLNRMVPNCDTNGTQPSEFGGGTRAQWAANASLHPVMGAFYPPFTCLKDYFENPTTHQNNASGGSVSGGWSSAQIIKYAADTYGISPKVLIVLLQKEQVLITDTWPNPGQYRSATGYGCPDTAPCDAEYYGFYNQVNRAAYQFKRYAQYPNEYRYKAYQNNTIQWNPSSSCGSSTVYIANQATAGLYNYTPYQPNQSALNNLYGSGDSCGAYGNRNFWRLYSDWFGSTQTSEVFLSYKSHISGMGWLDSTQNSGVTGTTGQSRAMEAFRINGSVEYSSYNNTTGWQPTVNGGMISGTTEMSRPIQAIKINPTDTPAARYDIYYRVHVSNIGWMGWAKNGQIAGVTGNNEKIEAIEIRLIAKEYGAPGSTDNAYQKISTTTYSPTVSLAVTSHVGSVGWQPTVTDTMVSGTIDQSKQMEAIKIALVNNTGQQGGITYASHLAYTGWQDYVSNNDISGTTGQARRMEAIKIALTGELGNNYDICYRGYVQYIGWMGWVKNGDIAGSVGTSRQLEAVETRIVAKGSPEPFISPSPVVEPPIASAGNTAIYRLLNAPTGQHFWTAGSAERDNLISVGYSFEGIAWNNQSSGASIYRLLNRSTGQHFWTASTSERDTLVGIGYVFEGIAWST